MSVTWSTYYATQPSGSDSPTLGDNSIREVKQAVRERFEKEHTMDLSSGSLAGDGMHVSGSAQIYYTSAAPTVRPDGVTAFAARDAGRVWVDSDAGNLPKVYDGAAFSSFLRELVRISIQGTLAAGTNVLPPIVFPRGCTIVAASMRVGSAPSGGSCIIDLNKNASGSIFSDATRLTIASSGFANSVSTFDAAEAAITADDYLTVDVDDANSAADLGLTIEALI